MEIGREIFWNVGQGARWITYALMVVMFIVVIYGLKKRYAMWTIGKATPFSIKERLGERIAYFIKSGVFHGSILKPREGYPGLHASVHLLGIPGACHRNGTRGLRGRPAATRSPA